MTRKKRLIPILVLVLIALTALPLFAGNKPLSLKESTPIDGASDVPIDVTIELEFSNNVVNFSVAEANRECISLKSEDGKDVEIEVIFPDDQLYPEKKRQVTVQPLSPLKKGSVYMLLISGEFQAKNGSLLGEEQVIRFTTAE